MESVVDAIGELNRTCGMLRGILSSTQTINGRDAVIMTPEVIKLMANIIEGAADILLEELLKGDEDD